MKLLLLPLDDRPCNKAQLAQLCAVAGIDVRLPPPELVATRGTPFEPRAIASWVGEGLAWADAAVLSVEQFVFGGLVRSRTLATSADAASARIRDLRDIVARRPSCGVYLSSVLTRLSITVTAEVDAAVWRRVFRYGVLAEKIRARPEPGEREELDRLRRDIPPAILADFLAARARNHAVNLAVAGLADLAQGILFGQEDCAEFGLHREERARLDAVVTARSEPERSRIRIVTGADELGALLVLHAFMGYRGVGAGAVPIGLDWSDPAGGDRVSVFEDIPAGENLRRHLTGSPFRAAADEERPAVVVRIRAFPAAGQTDLCFDPELAVSRRQTNLDAADAEWAGRVGPGDSLLDLTFGNGADPSLMESVARETPLDTLRSFSAWNTTGNRLGTLVAHLGLREAAGLAGVLDETADRRYVRTRLLDDYVYQSLVRPVLALACRERGENAWALGAAAQAVEADAEALVNREARRLGLGADLRVRLPWARLFEAAIDAR